MSWGTARRSAVRQAQTHMSGAAAKGRPWVERLARLGLAARGLLYSTIGLLAFRAAFGLGGKTTDQNGALVTLLHQPFGKVLLGLVTLGLFGYATWRLVQAFTLTQEENALKLWLKRIECFAKGAAHVILGLAAFKLLTGGGSGGSSTQDWSARFMNQPFGQWMVALAGLLVIGIGANALYRGWKAKFREKLRLGEMSPAEECWITRAGQAGYVARGITFGLIGMFLVQAALHYNPKEARGLSGALVALGQWGPGTWLLGLVAAGLLAFGVYQFAEARYRRVWE